MSEKKHRHLIYVGNGAFICCVLLILAADRFRWADTGFENKTVWDWLQLIIIPTALAVSALLFNQLNAWKERETVEARRLQEQDMSQQRYEQDQTLAKDMQCANVFQHYCDLMISLSLDRSFFTSREGDVVRLVGRDQTILALMQIDGRRASFLFQILREAQSLDAEHPLIDLNNADFSKVQWLDSSLSHLVLHHIRFRKACLQGCEFNEIVWHDIDFHQADLRQTSFVNAQITNVDFTGADLRGVNLYGATIINARWDGANLEGANLLEANLEGANLEGANLQASDHLPLADHHPEEEEQRDRLVYH